MAQVSPSLRPEHEMLLPFRARTPQLHWTQVRQFLTATASSRRHLLTIMRRQVLLGQRCTLHLQKFCVDLIWSCTMSSEKGTLITTVTASWASLEMIRKAFGSGFFVFWTKHDRVPSNDRRKAGALRVECAWIAGRVKNSRCGWGLFRPSCCMSFSTSSATVSWKAQCYAN